MLWCSCKHGKINNGRIWMCSKWDNNSRYKFMSEYRPWRLILQNLSFFKLFNEFISLPRRCFINFINEIVILCSKKLQKCSRQVRCCPRLLFYWFFHSSFIFRWEATRARSDKNSLQPQCHDSRNVIDFLVCFENNLNILVRNALKGEVEWLYYTWNR